MLPTIQIAHGHLRWLVVLAAVLFLVSLLITLRRKNGHPFERISGIAFMALLDVQLLLGLILLVGKLLQGIRLAHTAYEHALTMIIAVVLMHLTRRWKGLENVVRARKTLMFLLIAIVLIVVGVIRVGGSWGFGM